MQIKENVALITISHVKQGKKQDWEPDNKERQYSEKARYLAFFYSNDRSGSAVTNLSW